LSIEDYLVEKFGDVKNYIITEELQNLLTLTGEFSAETYDSIQKKDGYVLVYPHYDIHDYEFIAWAGRENYYVVVDGKVILKRPYAVTKGNAGIRHSYETFDELVGQYKNYYILKSNASKQYYLLRNDGICCKIGAFHVPKDGKQNHQYEQMEGKYLSTFCYQDGDWYERRFNCEEVIKNIA
jgi:hypothetical protein